MNRLVRSALLGLLLFVAGCDGGSDANYRPAAESSGPINEVPPVATQPALFDCNSVFPSPSSMAEAVLEDIWHGTLVDCTTGTSGNVRAYVTRGGQLRIQRGDPQLNRDIFSSAVETAGDTFAGEGRYFDATGGWSAALTVGGLIRDGSMVGRDRMEGLWVTDAGSHGYFALDYAGNLNHPPIPLQGWPAEWDIWASPSDAAGDWTIDSEGVVNGQDSDGCQYAGQFAAAEPHFFYELNLTVTGCALAGAYTGIGEPHSGPFNALLDVAVDDGDQRSLVILLGSK